MVLRQLSARVSKDDIGAMPSIGTMVLLDGVTLLEYVAQCNVNKYFVSDFVTSMMARICSSYFPDVLSVIQDMEANSSALSCKAMEGKASGGPDNGDGVCARVVFLIDVLVDMAYATHYDVGDCS